MPNQQHMYAWAHKTSAQVTVKNVRIVRVDGWGVGYIIYGKTKPIFDDLQTLQLLDGSQLHGDKEIFLSAF